MCPKVWGNIAIVYTKSACFAEFSLAGYHTARSLAQFFFYPNIGVSRLLLIRNALLNISVGKSEFVGVLHANESEPNF